MPLISQLLAKLSSATILPNDGIGEGLTCLAVPQYGRFTLVGDGD
jgi:hypothetical protein